MKAPWPPASSPPANVAHSWLQQLRFVLKPLNVCSAPTTTMFAALLGMTEQRLRAFRIRGCYPLRPAFPEPFSYTAAL
jgi:hypothetical protein